MANPTRFTSGVSTAAKGSVLWSMPAPDPTKVQYYFNDFNHNGSYVTTDFVNTETGSGTRAYVAGEPGGALLVTNAAADNDLNQFQTLGTFTLAAAKRAWFKTRFKVSDATQSDWLVGLAAVDTTLQGAVSGAGVTDGIFFNKDDGDALIDFQCQKNATTGQNRAVGIATNADSTYVILGWYYDGNGTVSYFVDDVQIGTIDASSSYFPDTALAVSFAMQNGEAVAKTMTVDYLLACMER